MPTDTSPTKRAVRPYSGTRAFALTPVAPESTPQVHLAVGGDERLAHLLADQGRDSGASAAPGSCR